jgi:hypothetical protein
MLAVGALFVFVKQRSERVDAERIRQAAGDMGWHRVRITWTPFAPQFYLIHGDNQLWRAYRVTYDNSSGRDRYMYFRINGRDLQWYFHRQWQRFDAGATAG